LPAHGVGLAEATRLWLRVALLSFGGAAGQIAVMHRIVVREPHWISEARFCRAAIGMAHRSRRIGMRLVRAASSSPSNPNSTASGPTSAIPATSPVDVMPAAVSAAN
jgi:hypothetical protein